MCFLKRNKKMQFDRGNFKWAILIYSLILSAFGLLFYTYVMPKYYLPVYFVLPVYFFLFGCVGNAVYSWALRNAPEKSTSFYLLVRIIKMVISVLGAVIYCVIDRKNAVDFLLTFAVVYILYLVFETWFYYIFESRKQKE